MAARAARAPVDGGDEAEDDNDADDTDDAAGAEELGILPPPARPRRRLLSLGDLSVEAPPSFFPGPGFRRPALERPPPAPVSPSLCDRPPRPDLGPIHPTLALLAQRLLQS